MGDFIEPATEADCVELSELINSAYRGESSKVGWTTEADLLDGSRTDADAISVLIAQPQTTLLKYVASGKILACVELRKEGQKLYLGMLTVSPPLQGRGIGKKLLRSAEQQAMTSHCTGIFMTVLSARPELIAWYTRHGYRATGERKPFAFNDPRFGLPKTKLEFLVLEKILGE